MNTLSLMKLLCIILLGEKLTTYYVCSQVKSAAPSLKSETRKQAIRAYAKAFYNLWVRSFVIHVNTTQSQIFDVVIDYEKFVIGPARHARPNRGIPSNQLGSWMENDEICFVQIDVTSGQVNPARNNHINGQRVITYLILDEIQRTWREKRDLLRRPEDIKKISFKWRNWCRLWWRDRS